MYRNNAIGVPREYHSLITAVDQNWVWDDGDFLNVKLWGIQINDQVQGGWTNPPPAGATYEFFTSQINLATYSVEQSLGFTVLTTLKEYRTPPTPAHPNGQVAPLPANCQIICYCTGNATIIDTKIKRLSYVRRVSTWATDEDEVPAYTPNDFFARFNTFPGDLKPPFRLGQDPNGGFRVSLLLDKMRAFSMSKQMVDDLGLNTFLTDPEVVQIDREHQQIVLPEVIPLDIHNDWLADYSGHGNFDARLNVGRLEDFSVIDPGGVVQGPLLVDTPDLTYLVSHINGNRYQLIKVHTNTVKNEQIADTKIEGDLLSDSHGKLFYQWYDPPQGSFLSNTQTVSLDSFAEFSSIRIVIPDGVIFQPMLAGRSDARILAELRLTFPLSPSQVLQGNGPQASPEGLLMSTSFTNYGDLLWHASPSKQYLQVTSGNPIYRINCEIRLVYRDPTRQPKVLLLGYKDLFELKLRLIQLQ